MGQKVWEQLKIRQQQLAQAGLKGHLVTFTDIITAANVDIRERNGKINTYEVCGRSNGGYSMSTPRKIVPSM
jgi:hypothetical protein